MENKLPYEVHWCDEQRPHSDDLELLEKVFSKVTNFSSLTELVRSQESSTPLVLIISGKLAVKNKEILKGIQNSYKKKYIFCTDKAGHEKWTKEQPGLIDSVHTKLKQLIHTCKQDLYSSQSQDFELSGLTNLKGVTPNIEDDSSMQVGGSTVLPSDLGNRSQQNALVHVHSNNELETKPSLTEFSTSNYSDNREETEEEREWKKTLETGFNSNERIKLPFDNFQVKSALMTYLGTSRTEKDFTKLIFDFDNILNNN